MTRPWTEAETRRLRAAARKRIGAQDIAKARRSTREVRIIGMVADIRTTKNGHRIIEIEDELERIAVLLPAESAVAQERLVAARLLPNMVTQPFGAMTGWNPAAFTTPSARMAGAA